MRLAYVDGHIRFEVSPSENSIGFDEANKRGSGRFTKVIPRRHGNPDVKGWVRPMFDRIRVTSTAWSR